MYQRKSTGAWCERLPGGKVITAKTKSALKKKLLEYNSQQQNGRKVRDALEAWEKSKEGNVTYKTIEGYQAPIKRLNEAFGDMYVTEVTPAMVQAFVNQLVKEGYKVSTVKRPQHVLSMMFDWLITTTGEVKVNPCSSVKPAKKLKQEHRELADPADVQRIKDGVKLEFGLFAYLLLYTGMRKGEALALTDKDFDFDSGLIRVGNSLSWQSNKGVVKEPKTENGIRSVVLLKQLRDELPKKWSGYLFSADGGKTPLTQIQFKHRWDGYCKAAGLCDVTEEKHTTNGHEYTKHIYKSRVVPHQLRHEFATICFEAGLEEIDTKEIMGHASISTTHAIYTHIRESRREKSTDRLQAFVNGEKL